MADDLEDLRSRLDAIAEELADRALDHLRASVEAGEQKAPVEERRLTRARLAVEKASAILAEGAADEDRD